MSPPSRDLFLTTPRIGFSHWSADDLPLAIVLWGNPQVTAYIGGPFSPEHVATRLALEVENQRVHGIQYWPLFSLETGDLMGCTGLRPYPADGTTLELGAHLLPAFWGKGYAQEATQAVIGHAFRVLGVQRLIAAHHPENRASQRLIRKLGFQFSHEALYAPTGLEHPWYVLANPTSP